MGGHIVISESEYRRGNSTRGSNPFKQMRASISWGQCPASSQLSWHAASVARKGTRRTSNASDAQSLQQMAAMTALYTDRVRCQAVTNTVTAATCLTKSITALSSLNFTGLKEPYSVAKQVPKYSCADAMNAGGPERNHSITPAHSGTSLWLCPEQSQGSFTTTIPTSHPTMEHQVMVLRVPPCRSERHVCPPF
jgi:hypothetical protein